MKYTNNFDYPEAYVLAVTNDPYNKGDAEFSATGLIKPPRIVALSEKHKDELEMDVDDRAFALWGQIGHVLLERAAPKNKITEKRFFFQVDGVKLSAQVDSLCLIDSDLEDYKFTAGYGFYVGQEPKLEWVQQLNIQLEAIRQNGLDAKNLRIWGLIRDWRPGEKKRIPGYPNKLGFHNIPVMPRTECVNMIRLMIKNHRAARLELPLCSEEERWRGKRCPSYCEVAKFCTQYKGATNGRS